MGLPWVQVVNAGTAAAGAQAPYACDWMQSPFNVGYSAEGISGTITATYNLEYTFDDVNTVASPEWFQLVGSGQTADLTGNFEYPARFFRVNFTSGPSGGSVTFRAVQGMTSR